MLLVFFLYYKCWKNVVLDGCFLYLFTNEHSKKKKSKNMKNTEWRVKKNEQKWMKNILEVDCPALCHKDLQQALNVITQNY